MFLLRCLVLLSMHLYWFYPWINFCYLYISVNCKHHIQVALSDKCKDDSLILDKSPKTTYLIFVSAPLTKPSSGRIMALMLLKVN